METGEGAVYLELGICEYDSFVSAIWGGFNEGVDKKIKYT